MEWFIGLPLVVQIIVILAFVALCISLGWLGKVTIKFGKNVITFGRNQGQDHPRRRNHPRRDFSKELDEFLSNKDKQ